MSQSPEPQPIEIEDEYKLGLEAGVEDESAEEATSVSFSIPKLPLIIASSAAS